MFNLSGVSLSKSGPLYKITDIKLPSLFITIPGGMIFPQGAKEEL